MVSIVASLIAIAQPQPVQQHVQLSVPQTTCLTETIYFESRGESTEGEAAVAYVVLNRAALEGKTICDVIHEKSQFSFYTPGRSLRVHDVLAWRESAEIAIDTQLGTYKNPIGNATFYNTVPVSSWRHVVYVKRIGHHLFYELPSTADAAPLIQQNGITNAVQIEPLRPKIVPISRIISHIPKLVIKHFIDTKLRIHPKIICEYHNSNHKYKHMIYTKNRIVVSSHQSVLYKKPG